MNDYTSIKSITTSLTFELLEMYAKRKQYTYITPAHDPNTLIDSGLLIQTSDWHWFQVNNTLFKFEEVINVIVNQSFVILRLNVPS